MAKRRFVDSRSCWKTAKQSEKPLEKCVSKVSLCDPEEVQRNQKVPGNDCSTRRSHKYMSKNCNPELFSVFPCWNTSQNQLRPTPAAEQPYRFVLRSPASIRFRLLNLCAAPAKNIPPSFSCWHLGSVIQHLEANGCRWRENPRCEHTDV